MKEYFVSYYHAYSPECFAAVVFPQNGGTRYIDEKMIQIQKSKKCFTLLSDHKYPEYHMCATSDEVCPESGKKLGRVYANFS